MRSMSDYPPWVEQVGNAGERDRLKRFFKVYYEDYDKMSDVQRQFLNSHISHQLPLLCPSPREDKYFKSWNEFLRIHRGKCMKCKDKKCCAASFVDDAQDIVDQYCYFYDPERGRCKIYSFKPLVCTIFLCRDIATPAEIGKFFSERGISIDIIEVDK